MATDWDKQLKIITLLEGLPEKPKTYVLKFFKRLGHLRGDDVKAVLDYELSMLLQLGYRGDPRVAGFMDEGSVKKIRDIFALAEGVSWEHPWWYKHYYRWPPSIFGWERASD